MQRLRKPIKIDLFIFHISFESKHFVSASADADCLLFLKKALFLLTSQCDFEIIFMNLRGVPKRCSQWEKTNVNLMVIFKAR